MTTKKVIILSSIATVVAGTAVWFFWLRKRGGITQDDRTNLKSVQIYAPEVPTVSTTGSGSTTSTTPSTTSSSSNDTYVAPPDLKPVAIYAPDVYDPTAPYQTEW